MFGSALFLSQITLKDLGIDLNKIQNKLPKQVFHIYIQVDHWLSDPPVTDESSPSQNVERFLNAIQDLCEAQNFEAAIQILKAQVESSVSQVPDLPLYSYLIYKGLAQELLRTTRIILDEFRGQEADRYFIHILQQ